MNAVVAARPFAPQGALLLVSFGLGLALSMGLLSGDAQGRVNVLLLLALFVLLPLLSMGVNLLAFFHPSTVSVGAVLSGVLSKLSRLSSTQWLYWRQSPLYRPWLILQSQYAALAYALGSLCGLLLLLLFTDVNFVWRSTLLSPEHLHPVLQAVATPWWFWSNAQPSYELLSLTQDSRLPGASSAVLHARWWPFIVATQLFYVLLLRLVMAFFSAWQLRVQQRNLRHYASSELSQKSKCTPQEKHRMTEVSHHLPGNFVWINWAGVEASLWRQLDAPLAQMPCLLAGPMATEQQQSQAQADSRPQVILVKAWEPPLAELGDYLREVREGVIVPLEIRQQQLYRPTPAHLDEWRRFVAQFPGWRLYLSEVHI